MIKNTEGINPLNEQGEQIEERQSNIKSLIDKYNKLDSAGKTDFWSEISTFSIEKAKEEIN